MTTTIWFVYLLCPDFGIYFGTNLVDYFGGMLVAGGWPEPELVHDYFGTNCALFYGLLWPTFEV